MVGGLVGAAGATAVAALVWMVVLSAASLYVANYAGFLWLGLHLLFRS
jgi:hypothetical protein